MTLIERLEELERDMRKDPNNLLLIKYISAFDVVEIIHALKMEELKSKGKHRMMTDAQIQYLNNKAAVRAFLHAVTLDTCYHMEEEGYDCDDEKLAEHIETVFRWEKSRKVDHDISANKANKLIKEITGLTIDYE